MKKLLAFLLLGLVLVTQPLFAQSGSLVQYNQSRYQIDQQLMLGLGSWASSNFVLSGIGWNQAQMPEDRYFHQMNVFWNVVNIGLAVPGYLKAHKANSDLSEGKTNLAQRKTEQIFLLNTCLDVAYVSSGVLLMQRAQQLGLQEPQGQRLNGYGKSLLVQGGFLFLFDLSAYCVHKEHGRALISTSMGSIGMSSTGLGLSLNLKPNN